MTPNAASLTRARTSTGRLSQRPNGAVSWQDPNECFPLVPTRFLASATATLRSPGSRREVLAGSAAMPTFWQALHTQSGVSAPLALRPAIGDEQVSDEPRLGDWFGRSIGTCAAEWIGETATVHAERARTRSQDRAVVAPVKVAPSGLPSAGPDGPPLTSAPPTRFCSEVRPRPSSVLPHNGHSRDIHSTHWVLEPKTPALGTPGETSPIAGLSPERY
jgi:hypothetical protein